MQCAPLDQLPAHRLHDLRALVHLLDGLTKIYPLPLGVVCIGHAGALMAHEVLHALVSAISQSANRSPAIGPSSNQNDPSWRGEIDNDRLKER